MNLLSRTKQLHNEKVSGVLLQFIKEGRAQEVLEALPEIQRTRPTIAEKLDAIKSEAQRALSELSKPKGFEPVKVDQCAHCGYTLRQYSRESVVMICEACGTQSNGNKKYKHNISIPTNPLLKLHATFDYLGTKWQVIGCQTYRGEIVEWDDDDDVWEVNPWNYHSWWIMNDKREMAWIDHDTEGYSWSYETKVKGKPPENNKETEYGTYELICSVGEFSYFPKKNERVKTFEKDDYSIEILLDKNGTQIEIEAFKSRKLSPLDLLAAFGRHKLLTQIGRLKFGLIAVLVSMLALFIGGWIISQFEEEILSFRSSPISHAGKNQRIPITLFSLQESGLLRFSFFGELPSNDGVFDAELVVEDPDHVLVAEIPFSFWRESGSDSDGPWTEAQKSDTVKLYLPAGANYQLSLAPDQMKGWDEVVLQGYINQNTTSSSPKYLGGIALIVLGISLYMIRRQKIRRATGLF